MAISLSVVYWKEEKKDVPHPAARIARDNGAEELGQLPLRSIRDDMISWFVQQLVTGCRFFVYLHGRKKCRRYLLVSKKEKEISSSFCACVKKRRDVGTVNRVRCRNKWLKEICCCWWLPNIPKRLCDVPQVWLEKHFISWWDVVLREWKGLNFHGSITVLDSRLKRPTGTRATAGIHCEREIRKWEKYYKEI